jgi:uncharacterized phage protein gp47/JayE
MPSYPLATLAAQISSTGIFAPSYPDIFSSLQASFEAIYGSDAYLEPDSQDGQLLAIVAQAINDSNNTAIAVYNAFSPTFAQGVGLSTIVKINGLARIAATNSTADLVLVGNVGTPINNGIVVDANNNQWALPPSVIIPEGGTITVTATCQTPGAVAAAENTISQIGNPTRGWASATNPAAATAGQAAETDAALRIRQALSTSIPALTVLESLYASVANLAGVEAVRVYENDTGTTDDNGIPGHSISFVVEGGDAVAIATAIARKKTPGTGTYGTTTEIITDQNGVPNTINFFRPATLEPAIAITIRSLTGYVETTGTAIIQAIVDYVNGLGIGGGNGAAIEWDATLTAAKSTGVVSNTYNIQSVTIAGGSPDLAVPFNELPLLQASDVTLTVTG